MSKTADCLQDHSSTYYSQEIKLGKRRTCILHSFPFPQCIPKATILLLTVILDVLSWSIIMHILQIILTLPKSFLERLSSD